jgi:hypothetical protein
MTPVTARVTIEPPASDPRGPDSRVSEFPRLRYMGSKYRLVPYLADVFTELGGGTALDAFSGSGVVSYLLKTLGYQVTANDFLTFPSVIARATGQPRGNRPPAQGGTGRARPVMPPAGLATRCRR